MAAAELGALGLDPMRFLETRDPFERNLMATLAGEIAKARRKLDQNLAVEIANQVGKLFSR